VKGRAVKGRLPLALAVVALDVGLGLLPLGPAAAGEGGWFRDATAAVGLTFRHHNGATGELYFAEIMGPGGALFDLDGDGDLDLYIPQGETLGTVPPESSAPGVATGLAGGLFRNDLLPAGNPGESLHLVEISRAAGLPRGVYGMGVAVGDVDDDGFPDLYLTALGDNHLLRNLGNGAFEDVTATTGTGERRWSVGAVFFDFDRDGHLDLYVVNYVDFTPAKNKFCPDPTGAPDYCGPAAYPPLPDRLFHNLGGGTFEDVSGPSGITALPASGLGAVSGDFDGDGLPDLYVANDGMGNHLFLTQGDGTFRDEAALAGCAVSALGVKEASMGIAIGDADGEGGEDLLLTHLHGETNTLYLGDGRGLFRDATEVSGLATPSFRSTGFGTGFFDLDNDGDLDLYVGNGHVTLFAGRGRGLALEDQLFRNRGDGHFDEVPATEAGEAFARREVSRGTAFGDVDNDGDTDLLLVHNDGPARLLLNEGADGGAWIGVRTLTAEGRDARDTRVEVLRSGKPPLLRRVRSEGSYASANDPRVLAGLGLPRTAPSPLTLRLTAPDGRRRVIRGVPAGNYLNVRWP